MKINMNGVSLWKIRSKYSADSRRGVEDGERAWTNPCEVRGCLQTAARFFATREVCDVHYSDLTVR